MGLQEIKNYKLTKTDITIIICITLVYGIISFLNLGSLTNPQSFWTPSVEDSSVVIDFGESQDIKGINHYSGARFGDFKIYTSNDNKEYTYLTDMKQDRVFAWNNFEINANARYLKIEASDTSKPGIIGEISPYDEAGNTISVSGIGDGDLVTDEPSTVPKESNYMNSTYFDEIYHGRTAYEFAHGMEIYEWTHPPLGKLIMSIPVKLLGMSTFSYRLMGNIAGILMLFVIYVFGKRIFGSTRLAALAAVIFAADGMHFVQTRIGTVDTFLVLFMMCSMLYMYQYTQCETKGPIKQKLLNLLGSGIFLGCSLATKWTGAYMAVGLAVIFFIDLYERFRDGKTTDGWDKQSKTIVLSCFGFFVAIPVLIYTASYIPTYFIKGKPDFIPFLINEQVGMYKYHSGLDATHPYSSSWWSWPFGYKPVWYYSGKAPEGMVSSISAHSNPFIWWTGIVGMIYAFKEMIVSKSKEYRFLVIGILALFVPYILVPRVMYLYHYFPIVPMMILATVGLIKQLEHKYNKNIVLTYAIIAVLTFAFCYPIYSGMLVPRDWARLISLNGLWQLY